MEEQYIEVWSEEDIPPGFTGVADYTGGKKERYKNGLLHSEGDLPSSEDPQGHKTWHKNDSLHRDGDKPAIILDHGTHQEWLQHGRRHRLLGPAIIGQDEDGNQVEEYWIDDKQMSKEEWQEEVTRLTAAKTVEIELGPEAPAEHSSHGYIDFE
jgi:hypothetical protein